MQNRRHVEGPGLSLSASRFSWHELFVVEEWHASPHLRIETVHNVCFATVSQVVNVCESQDTSFDRSRKGFRADSRGIRVQIEILMSDRVRLGLVAKKMNIDNEWEGGISCTTTNLGVQRICLWLEDQTNCQKL